MLAERPWAAEISARASADPGDRSARTDRLAVRFEPGGAVHLRLGTLRVEATPGRLIAVHQWNDHAYYEALLDGLPPDRVLAAELPPLWCPWLAIALAQGDPGAWPVVGEDSARRIKFSGAPPEAIQTEHGSVIRFTGGMTSGPGVARAEVRGGAAADNAQADAEAPPTDAAAPLSWIRAYEIEPDSPATRTRLRFEAEPTNPAAWPSISLDGRTPVASLAALAPPPPEIGFGDRLPVLSFSAVTREDLTDHRWRPLESLAAAASRRPAALVLVLATPRVAGPVARRAATAVTEARLQIARGDPPAHAVVARPVLCVEVDDLDRASAIATLEAWTNFYEPDRTAAEIEQAAPGLAWLPAAHLLRRVAPASDAALVIVDRAGWIIAVLSPDADADEIAGSILAADRARE
jgi:hypothetical protein